MGFTLYSVEFDNERIISIPPQPYTARESYEMMRAKVAADLSGEQQRMDEVFPNIFIGNKFAAEDAHYLALNKITHVLNMAHTVIF